MLLSATSKCISLFQMSISKHCPSEFHLYNALPIFNRLPPLYFCFLLQWNMSFSFIYNFHTLPFWISSVQCIICIFTSVILRKSPFYLHSHVTFASCCHNIRFLTWHNTYDSLQRSIKASRFKGHGGRWVSVSSHHYLSSPGWQCFIFSHKAISSTLQNTSLPNPSVNCVTCHLHTTGKGVGLRGERRQLTKCKSESECCAYYSRGARKVHVVLTCLVIVVCGCFGRVGGWVR